MPNYTIAGGVVALQPGDIYLLWNAESPSATQASIPFAVGYAPGGSGASVITFTAEWATTPTAVLSIYGSNKAPAATFTAADWTPTALGTITAQSGYYADAGGFAFYCAVLTSQSAGGAITVTVKR
jgi:hypothetical protein